MDCIEVFYIDTNKLLPLIDKESMAEFLDNKNFKSEKRRIQYSLGRFIVKYVLKKYGVNNPAIVIKNNKPCLPNKKIHFSISHTKNIILVAFWKENIACDIEFMKERDYSKVFKYCKVYPENQDKQTFYRFWTEYEAEIKLQELPKSSVTFELLKDFMLTVSVNHSFDIKNKLKIYELVNPNANTSPNELINLKLVIDNNKNENTLVAQEINTAAFESTESFNALNLKTE